MSFITDKQTLDDLNLVGRYKPDSIFNFFNQVKTSGGEKLLEKMFREPLVDADEINRRADMFAYFKAKQIYFPLNREEVEEMENYLDQGVESNIVMSGFDNLKKLVLRAAIKDEQYSVLQSGLQATVLALQKLKIFIDSFDEDRESGPFNKELQVVTAILNDKRLTWLSGHMQQGELSVFRFNNLDHLFRVALKEKLETIIRILYQLDVYIVVGNVAAKNNFTQAKALPKIKNVFVCEELWHPALKNGVANDISFHRENNVMFLTGANMAGKSTLMKTFGIAVYLAHMGFPVAAKSLSFSVKDGIYSSINVADNLNMGYSHFYAEVLRVKKVAEEVSSSKDIVVIFDELFKGTNVKDAYDATLAVTGAFSAYRNCFFIISTHIIEVGEALGKSCANVQFCFLPTVMEGKIPRYTYHLESGITTDRQGMIIIENEGILELLPATNYNKQLTPFGNI